MYKNIRTIHLILASFSLPFLIMYGVSAVQMAHGSWFQMKPTVQSSHVRIAPGLDDGREVARQVTSVAPHVKGELANVKSTAGGLTLRLVVPGTVHEVQYQRTSGEVALQTSVASMFGMLNRLHHAVGLRHETRTLNLWGIAVAVVSAALILLGATGIYMWFIRRSERRSGIILIALNVVVVVWMLAVMRSAGP
jgi:hypothetical protein